MFVGLAGIAYVNQRGVTLEDPETVFIMFSNALFHPFITGFLLSAILWCRC
jgi:solute:Na+ symporter, SSS family